MGERFIHKFYTVFTQQAQGWWMADGRYPQYPQPPVYACSGREVVRWQRNRGGSSFWPRGCGLRAQTTGTITRLGAPE